MKRYHNTNSKNIYLEWEYNQKKKIGDKPDGFWYDIDKSWLKWCKKGRKPFVKDYLFKIDIDTSNIFIVTGKSELEYLDKYYGYKNHCMQVIDWELMSVKYTGIEIRNYQKLKDEIIRMSEKYNWLWHWDLSSGCIWDLSIINNVKKVNNFDPRDYLDEKFY